MHFLEFDSIWDKFVSNGLIYSDRRQTTILTNYEFDKKKMSEICL